MKKVNLNEVKNKILPVFLLILLLVGGSYAWFNYVKVGDKTQVVRAGKYSFKLEECENDIILKNAVPESAKKGLEEEVCTFKVQNTGSVSGEYTVYLDDEELEEKEKRMNDSFVRYSLVKGDEEESEEKTKLLTTTGTNPERVMATGTLNKGEEDVYHLKVWIDSEATNEVMSTIFYGKLRVKIDQTTKQTVTINPNGGVYNKKKENTVIAKKTGETVEIVGEPEREGYEFAGWEIEEGTVITGNIITVGKKNITLKAKWNVSKDAVARINDNYYTSLEKALEAAKETGDTIVMVKDTSESVVNQKDVTLDLENHTVTSKEEQTIINNGTLKVIKSGTIENTNKKVIVNNGVLILGEDDSEVSQKNPYIKGSELGIEQKGTMKFYDGLVEAKVGITGEVNEVAEGHYVFVDHDDQTGNQKVYLVETLTKAVVKTNGTIPIYYFNLQDAINTTTITQEKIEAIRNFEAAYELAIKADTNIGIDIKGYTVETGNKITNEGNLTIKDTGSEKGVLKPSVSITNNGKLIFEGIAVEETTDVNVVENSGNLEINSSTITAKGGYAVNNKDGNILSDGNGIISSTSNYVLNIENNELLTISNLNIKGKKGINSKNAIKLIDVGIETSGGYGIYADNDVTLDNININSNNAAGIVMNSGKLTMNSGNIYVSNTSDGVIIGSKATGEFNDGSITVNYVYNNEAISVSSSTSTVTINGGTYKGIYALSSRGTTTITGGTFIGTGYKGLIVNGGTTTITGGDITGGTNGISVDSGTLKIKNSTVTGGIVSRGNTTIEKTNITGQNGVTVYKNSTKILDSKIIGTTYGVYNDGGTLTIGNDDDNVDKTTPVIIGETYGLYVKSGTTNIYDGIFKGKTGGYSGTITNMPDGYTLKEESEDIDGVTYTTNYLGENATFLQVGDKKFNTINKAITEAKETGDEIVLISDATTSSQGIINENEKITLDMKGHTLNISSPLSNAGNLIIKNTNEEQRGKIISGSTTNGGYVIESTGTININKTDISGQAGIKNTNTTNLIDVGIETSGGYGIYADNDVTLDNININSNNAAGIVMNSGKLTMNSGNIYVSNTSDGVIIGSKATGEFNDGSITVNYVYNNEAISVSSSTSTVTINGGTYKGIYALSSRGTTTITGGTFIGTGYKGLIVNGGTTTITGGDITGGTYGISVDSGTLNIGKNDGKINESPVIMGKEYGIISYSNKYNFYDGIIKGKIAALYNMPSSIADSSGLVEGEETIDNETYQTVALVKNNESIKNGDNKYNDLQTAIDESSNGDKIEILDNISSFYTVNVPNDKNITIDTKGNVVNLPNGITNNGILTVNSGSTEKGTIKTTGSASAITNNGTLTISNNLINSNKTTSYAITNNAGANLQVENSEINSQNGIKNLSNMTLNNTDVSTTKDYAIYNSNNNQYQINITGGNIIGNVYSNGSTKDEIAITEVTQNGIITNNNTNMVLVGLNSTFVNTNGSGINYSVSNSGGSLKVLNSSFDNTNKFYYSGMWNYKSTLCSIYNTNQGTLNVKNSNSVGKTIETANVSSICGIYLDNTAGITNVDIDGYTTSLDSYKEAYGIYVSGAENDSSINIKNANININTASTGYGIYETSTSNDFNVNLISGNIYTNAITAYGVYVDSGSLTMGIKDGDGSENATVDKENPFVKAVGTTGIGVKKNNGYFKYYDGKIMGSTNAKPDTTTDTEYNYEAVMHTDQETGYEYCVLEYMK